MSEIDARDLFSNMNPEELCLGFTHFGAAKWFVWLFRVLNTISSGHAKRMHAVAGMTKGNISQNIWSSN
jgi:hypothetical protein